MSTVSKYNYKEIGRRDILSKLNIKNIHQLVFPITVILNTSSKQNVVQKKNLVFSSLFLEILSSKKTGSTKLKNSVANFKARKGFPVGNKVTLRKNFVYQFLDKLHIQILSSTRDFICVPKTSHLLINIGIEDCFSVCDIEIERFVVKSSSKICGFNICFSSTLKLKNTYEDKIVKLILSLFRIP
jgi:ribosomal protein L5